MRSSVRRRIARLVCRRMPPILAQRVRCWIYPYTVAQREDQEVQVRAATGGWFAGRTSDFHGYPMSVHGYYEWRNVAVCAAVCRPGDTILEVGANVGTETVSFADLVGPGGRVMAFEPDACNAEALRRLVALNGQRHVEVIEAAVSDVDGEVWFEETPLRAASGIGRVVGEGMSTHAKPVRCVRLDTLPGSDGGKVAAVFMDVEGHEVAVLRGAKELLRVHRPVLVLEASPALLARGGWSLEDLVRELEDAGYVYYRVGRFDCERVNTSEKKAGNWLCLAKERAGLLGRIRDVFGRACWLPMVAGLNPIAR